MSTEEREVVVVGLGAWGSATAYELARRGHDVLGLEQLDLGHERGASHDTSRILRHSYHTPSYVALTEHAYDDWARLERDSDEDLVTQVGGVDLFPPGPAIGWADYEDSLTARGIPFDVLDGAAARRRWPALSVADDVRVLHQERASIVHAALTTSLLQREARRRGAELRERTPVTEVATVGGDHLVTTPAGEVRCRRLVVCADAWAEQVLAGLGTRLGLVTTLEQVTYFGVPADAVDRHSPGTMPLWIWMDDPSFYGFPCYGTREVKAAQDCGGPRIDPDVRGPGLDVHDVDDEMLARLSGLVGSLLPGVGAPTRSKRCQYTLTPDRDFVLSTLPDHPGVVVGLGAAHGFKFTPTAGRMLADLVEDGTVARAGVDVEVFSADRAALSDPGYAAHWLV